MSYTFHIDGKFFETPIDGCNKDSFVVKSFPYSYEVVWDEGEALKGVYEELNMEGNAVLLVDAKVQRIHLESLKFDANRIFGATVSEKFKTMSGVLDIVDFLNRNEFTKGEKFISVGGGIIEDVAAFVRACYRRGIDWIYFPTTLLSMCDSCIGGKTGINYQGAKNQLALFSAPAKVIINPTFLKTLEIKEIHSGLGEVLKLHITGGADLFESFQDNLEAALNGDLSAYKTLILQSLSVKRVVVEVDEFESNYRKSMNYGHTIGHAIESLSEYRISHGEAVIIGILIVNQMSLNREMLSDGDNEKIRDVSFRLLTNDVVEELKKLNLSHIGPLLKKDKKTMGRKANFVLLKDIGNIKIIPIEINEDLILEIQKITSRLIQQYETI